VGRLARALRTETQRRIRAEPLTAAERERLAEARYEGSPLHKRNPGDFGLVPPSMPRPDKTLCDEAGIHARATADELFAMALARGICSESTGPGGFPKQLWVVDAVDRCSS
jgi:hypothetical protein